MKSFTAFIKEQELKEMNMVTLVTQWTKQQFDVYKNTSSSDLSKLFQVTRSIGDKSPYVRYLIDAQDQACLVWQSWGSTHADVFNKLKKLSMIPSPPSKGLKDFTRFYTGEAEIRGGELIHKSSDIFDGLEAWLRDQKTHNGWKGDWISLQPCLESSPDWLDTYFPRALLQKIITDPLSFWKKFEFSQKYISGLDSHNIFQKIKGMQ